MSMRTAPRIFFGRPCVRPRGLYVIIYSMFETTVFCHEYFGKDFASLPQKQSPSPYTLFLTVKQDTFCPLFLYSLANTITFLSSIKEKAFESEACCSHLNCHVYTRWMIAIACAEYRYCLLEGACTTRG